MKEFIKELVFIISLAILIFLGIMACSKTQSQYLITPSIEGYSKIQIDGKEFFLIPITSGTKNPC